MTMTRAEQEQYEDWLEITQYWTVDRMAAAVPDEAPAGVAQPLPPPSEPPGAFQTELVLDPAKKPYYRRAGVLFYVRDGIDRYGSACAITKNGILTAAHCLYGSTVREYSAKAAYVPGYQDHEEPLGRWRLFDEYVVPDPWKEKVNRAWDYGFSKVGLGGKNGLSVLGDVTGHFSLAVDRPDVRAWEAVGYPGVPVMPDYPFNEEYMWKCRGDMTRQPTLNVIGKQGNLTEGSSGGPWLIPGHDYVNGVGSYHNDEFPGENFSPYFDKDVLALYNKAFRS